MGKGTTFSLLGPLLIRNGDAELPISRGKQRAVLAALLLDANRIVTLEKLADVLWWPGPPPPSARVTVQNYVKRIRHALRDANHTRISTYPGGYQVRVYAGELDLSRFETLLKTARAAGRDRVWQAAADRARAALALWRGEPLADVESDMLAVREIPRLAEARVQALETRIDAELRLRRHADVIPELRRLTAAHPLRERLHALLMLALYRDGCQGEALAVYRQAHQILAEELGSGPGAELRELHQRILAADPRLNVPDPHKLRGAAAVAKPWRPCRASPGPSQSRRRR